jgi:hypothetical protein
VCFVPGNDNIDVSGRLACTCGIYLPFHSELSRIIAVKRAFGIAPKDPSTGGNPIKMTFENTKALFEPII